MFDAGRMLIVRRRDGDIYTASFSHFSSLYQLFKPRRTAVSMTPVVDVESPIQQDGLTPSSLVISRTVITEKSEVQELVRRALT